MIFNPIIEYKQDISEKYINKIIPCKKCGSKPIIKSYFNNISGNMDCYICCPNCDDNKIDFSDHLERVYPIWNEKQKIKDVNFRGKIIPSGIHFYDYDFINEDFVGNDKNDCDCMTNGGTDIDPYEGVTDKNKNCRRFTCARCIFFRMNANDRLAYFKYLKGIKNEN